MSRLTIEELKRVQHHADRMDVHFVSLDEDGFTIAHTDDERAHLGDLEKCSLHQWLLREGPPEIGDEAPAGIYIVTAHEPDGYSESYRSDPWEFEPVVANPCRVCGWDFTCDFGEECHS
jgi:hypothetical protein